MEQDLLVQLLQMLLGKLGVMPQVVAVLLGLQSINKLLQVVIPALRGYVEATPSKKDDELLGQVSDSKLIKALKFAIDFLLRIKL